MLCSITERVHTIASDNGKEFAYHWPIAEKLKCGFYFSHVYSQHGKESQMNTATLIRQYFMENRDFRTITDEEIFFAMKRLNNQPNKLLYNISNQVSSWRNVMTFYKNDLMLNSPFSKENLSKAEKEIRKYPKDRKASAILALLFLVQKQNDNWIPLAAIKYVAKFLGVPYIQVYEVSTFYSMFNLTPVGKYFVQICTTTPCMMRGSKKIVDICKKHISKNPYELSENKLCSWTEVECLGACVNAPMMQINQDYFEDLDDNKTEEIIQTLLEDKFPTPGSAKNRKNTAPEKGKTTLIEVKNA